MSKKVIVATVVIAVTFLLIITAIPQRLDSLFPRPDHWLGTTVAEQFIILLIHDHLAQGIFVLGVIFLAGLGYFYRRQLDEHVGL